MRKSRLGSLAEGGGKEPHPFKGGGARPSELERRSRELERVFVDGFGRRLELSQYGVDVNAPMRRCVGRQATARLLELPLTADPVPPAGLVPGDCDVHEPLEEVALGRVGRAPCFFQLLVGREELAGANQLQAALERVVPNPGLRSLCRGIFPRSAARRRP